MRKGAPMEKGVEIKEIVEKMDLKNLTPEIEMKGKKVEVPDINRPALQLSGCRTCTNHWICGTYIPGNSGS